MDSSFGGPSRRRSQERPRTLWCSVGDESPAEHQVTLVLPVEDVRVLDREVELVLVKLCVKKLNKPLCVFCIKNQSDTHWICPDGNSSIVTVITSAAFDYI